MHTSFGTFLSLLFELIMVFLQVDSKKKNPVFLTRVEPVTFWSLLQMR